MDDPLMQIAKDILQERRNEAAHDRLADEAQAGQPGALSREAMVLVIVSVLGVLAWLLMGL